MSNIIQAPCGLRLDGNNFSVEENSGVGYLTSNFPFIIAFFRQEDGSLLTNIDFEDAKEIIKTTPIRFAEVIKDIDKNTVVNTFGLISTKSIESNLLTDTLFIPSYCSDPYELSEQFEPKGIGECFFFSADENENVIDVSVWTKEGSRNLRISK